MQKFLLYVKENKSKQRNRILNLLHADLWQYFITRRKYFSQTSSYDYVVYYDKNAGTKIMYPNVFSRLPRYIATYEIMSDYCDTTFCNANGDYTGR